MKLNEMNGWELMGGLVELAEPIGNLVNDEPLWECFLECTRQAVRLRQKDGLAFILRNYAKLIPLLFGDDHKRDVVRILAVVEGMSVEEAMKKNGFELLRDFRAAYREQLAPFFTSSVPTASIV